MKIQIHSTSDEYENDMLDLIETHFGPEFRNWLSEMEVWRSLGGTKHSPFPKPLTIETSESTFLSFLKEGIAKEQRFVLDSSRYPEIDTSIIDLEIYDDYRE